MVELERHSGYGKGEGVKYGVILADPPWVYQNSAVRGNAADKYTLTDTACLCEMPIASLAAPDSVLVMWATWPCLTDAMQLIPAWGFKYVTAFPWVKLQDAPFVDLMGDHVIGAPAYGTGFWVRGCTEPILIAKRGQPRIPESGHLGLISKRFEHSRKPDNIYDYCETMDGPYLELFARRRRPGWNAFGNEVEGSIQLTADAV